MRYGSHAPIAAKSSTFAATGPPARIAERIMTTKPQTNNTMNIFTRKKALLAEIANLNEQIRIQSNEMDKLRKANTGLNRLWRDAVKENKRLEQVVVDTLESKRVQGCIDAKALGEKNKTVEELRAAITEKDKTIAELNDVNAGLASSVSDLKARLRKATAERKPKRNPKASSNHEQTSQQ